MGEVATTKFIEEYRKRQENRILTEEEKSEMEAAFGQGEIIVDVLTGKKYYL